MIEAPPIRISEIFGPTLQGEGAAIGKPTIFIRTGGCDYRCSWCDSLYAVLPEYRSEWKQMSAEDVMAKVHELSRLPMLVTLSGGNPALQPLAPLIKLGQREGYEFTMETQGSAWRDWMSELDYLCISPKPPSSGMWQRGEWRGAEMLARCINEGPEDTIIKVVVFDDADYDFARSLYDWYPEIPYYLQVGNHKVTGESDQAGLLKRFEWLAEKVLADGWTDVTVLPQLHVLLWGNKRGV